MPCVVEVQPWDHHGTPWNQLLIFINYISDKELESGIYKEFSQLKKQQKAIKNGQRI